MLPFSNETITVYNAYEVDLYGNGKPVKGYSRYVLQNCSWRNVKTQSLNGTTYVTSDEIQVQIPENSNFVDFWEWEKLTLEEMQATLTATIGTVVILGDVEDELQPGANVAELVNKYENRAFIANYFSNNTGDGVPLGHYLLRG